MAGGEEKSLQKIQLPSHLFLKKCICPVFINNRSCIVAPINLPKIMRKAVHLNKSLCKWLMNPACKKLTRKFGVIYEHLCLHFSTWMIQNFVLKVSHFIFKSSSYLELIKSYCPFQACSYLLNKKCWPSCVQAQKSECSVIFCTGDVIKQTLHCP